MAAAMPSGDRPDSGSSRFLLYSATSTVTLFSAQRISWFEGRLPEPVLDSEWALGASITLLTLAVGAQWWRRVRPHLPDILIRWRRDEDESKEGAGGGTR